MTDGMAGAFSGLFRRRGRTAPHGDELARVEAEITAFGEALAGHPFRPDHQAHGSRLLADHQRALDAYERAKRDFAGDRTLRDAADVLRALDEGRHALACVDAAVAGRPRPHRLPLCFFDPRHGPSAQEVRWAPAGGAARTVAVCAADAVRLAEGRAPIESGLRERTPDPRAASRTKRRPAHEPAPPASAGDPYGTCPLPAGTRQRRENRGSAEVQLSRTDRRAPALLVVHLERADGSWADLTGPAGAGGQRRQLLTHGSVLTRAVVPVPADGRDTIHLSLHTRRGWRIWLHPMEDIPLLTGEVSSTGTYVLRHPGGREPLRVTQHEGSAFSLHALRSDFRPGELLC
ncbi:hypothetical protein [Streptomyces xanthii]|uniref:Uncharacterized protein n=1 Tax=Streptomyces xanthii TaxID=2768069 RepID=A0A7H1B4C8_9ACTN|nr:hypothetical protein [Streptomyces xanthii]QNS03583.1 hypothetical protein IAG42_08055 [Streptomyces xanthii]